MRGNDSVKLGQVPKNQFSVWNRYDVSEKIGLGLGVIHQSSQFAALRIPPQALPAVTPVSTLLPGFTRVDAALYFDVSEAVQVQANVENLFDTRYFSDAHNVNNITPGAPVNGRVTVEVRF